MTADGRVSKALFGNANLLSVAEAAAGFAGAFTGRALAAGADLPDPVVTPIVRRLSEGRVIVLKREVGRSREYEVVDGPFWDLIRSLA
ncbi:MAG: hypothetical protein QOK43_2200 [Acidimicrobiaceae bacterium]|nr:hypothetical protein [Acidimicrobiaceae bacterium]